MTQQKSVQATLELRVLRAKCARVCRRHEIEEGEEGSQKREGEGEESKEGKEEQEGCFR